MWFGSRLIILGNSGFRCCYESCDFTVQKFEDENKSCSVMMDHMKSEHIGKTQGYLLFITPGSLIATATPITVIRFWEVQLQEVRP